MSGAALFLLQNISEERGCYESDQGQKKAGRRRFFEGIAEFFTSTVKAFVEGDIFVKLSALLCGTSCFARKQYLKGFFICLIQAAIMLVFPTFFFPYMSKLSTLGTGAAEARFQSGDDEERVQRLR